MPTGPGGGGAPCPQDPRTQRLLNCPWGQGGQGMHSLLRGALAKAGAGGDHRLWVVTHRHCTCQLGRHNHDFAKTPKNIKKRQERQRPKRTPPRQGKRFGVGFSICRITTFPETSLETPPPLQGPPPPSSQPSPPGGAQRWHREGMGEHGPPGLRSINHSAQTGVPTREGGRPAALSLTRCARGPASRQQPQRLVQAPLRC